MGVWSEKVVPIIHRFLWKDDTNKAAAEQACKYFDESKDEINKEFEEKKGVLKPKVIEIYEASSTEIKSLIKEPKGHGLKKHSVKVQKFLDELVKIDFPGSKAACEATTKYGLTLVQEPVKFVFEKVSIFVVTEEVATKEAKAPPPPQPQPQATSAETTTKEPPATTTTTTTVNKEIVVEKAVVKEPHKGNAPANTVKETPKVSDKKEEPLKA